MREKTILVVLFQVLLDLVSDSLNGCVSFCRIIKQFLGEVLTSGEVILRFDNKFFRNLFLVNLSSLLAQRTCLPNEIVHQTFRCGLHLHDWGRVRVLTHLQLLLRHIVLVLYCHSSLLFKINAALVQHWLHLLIHDCSGEVLPWHIATLRSRTRYILHVRLAGKVLWVGDESRRWLTEWLLLCRHIVSSWYGTEVLSNWWWCKLHWRRSSGLIL